MPFHEFTDPGPDQIIVWLDRAFSKLGPTELTEIVKYNNADGYILQKDDFNFVKRHYPMLMANYFSESYDEFTDFVNDALMRKILIEHFEDFYCPDCGDFIKDHPDEVEGIEPSKVSNDRLTLENKSILKYDRNSNWILKKEYNSKNKQALQIDNRYNNNNKCIETIQKSDVTESSKTKISYNSSGVKIKSSHFNLEEGLFGLKEIPDGYTEYYYDNNDLLIKEVSFDEQNSVVLTSAHKYDNGKLIEQTNNFEKSLIEYDSNGEKIIEIFYDEYGEFISKSKFEYYDKRLIACGYFDADDNIKSISKYTYDKDGNMIEDVYYKMLNKRWCEKCNKWVFIKKRDEPPQLEY